MSSVATASPVDVSSLWRSMLPSTDEIRAARRRLHAKATVIGLLVVTSYAVLVLSSLPLLVRMGAAVTLAFGLVAVGTGIMHDANHGAFSARRWVNRWAAYTSDALGASSWLWRHQHNFLHHGNTNVVGFDADIAQAPLARLAPTQPWHRWHRYQHLYLWPLYGFMAVKNLLISDLLVVVKGRFDDQPLREKVRPSTVVRITLGKFLHLGWAVVIPLLFNPWWAVLAFYVGCSWLVGFILAVVFQLAHCVSVAEFAEPECQRRGDDFVSHQLRTTVDIDSRTPVVGPAFRWLVGGLDHQIEHHLAPRLPHTIYPRIARRFRRACAERGVNYRVHDGLWAALRSHVRWLRQMGSGTALSA